MTPVAEEAGVPLLPISNATPRGPSPNPSTNAKMWAGDPNKLTPAIHGTSGASAKAAARDKDLTNTKLAKNQYVLLEQIEALRQTVETQGEMLSVLMSALADKNGVAMPSPTTDRMKGKGKGKRKEGDSDDDEPPLFGVGDDESSDGH